MMVSYGWNTTGNNMLGKFEKIDRRIKEPKLEPIDAIMLTLEGRHYARKGHNNDEPEGAKAAKCNSQSN